MKTPDELYLEWLKTQPEANMQTLLESMQRGESFTHKAFLAGLESRSTIDAEVSADAERYRFIRGDGYYVVPDGQYIPSVHGEALDILIDAALAKHKAIMSPEGIKYSGPINGFWLTVFQRISMYFKFRRPPT